MAKLSKYQKLKIDGKSYILLPEKEYRQLVERDKKKSSTQVEKSSHTLVSLGERIKAARLKFGLSGEEFAAIAHTTQAQVSRLEGGQSPRAKTIHRIETALRALSLRQT